MTEPMILAYWEDKESDWQYAHVYFHSVNNEIVAKRLFWSDIDEILLQVKVIEDLLMFRLAEKYRRHPSRYVALALRRKCFQT